MLLDGKTAPGLPFLRRLHWIVSVDPLTLLKNLSDHGVRSSATATVGHA
jgi:hypothetical protein